MELRIQSITLSSPGAIFQVTSLLLVSIALTTLIVLAFPQDANWHEAFYPSGRAFLEGRNPYEVGNVFNPPWAFLIIGPLSAIPEAWGRAILLVASTAIYLYVALRFGAGKLALLAFLLSPPVFSTVFYVNLDAFALMGLLLPPHIGLFFLLLKPQFGLGIALFWAIEQWQARGWKPTLTMFAPLAFTGSVSLILYGNSYLQATNLANVYWNYSPFPYFIPVAVGLFYLALKRHSLACAIPTSLCASPYLGLSSWVGAYLALIRYPRLCAAASLIFWLLILPKFR